MAQDLTRGSIPKLTLRLALPGVLSLLGITVNHFIDGIWVGKIGPQALAAIAPAAFIIWIIFSLVDIMPIGLVAIISRYYGEKRIDKAEDVSQKINQFIILVSFIFLALGVFFSRYAIEMVGVSEEVVRLGTIYLEIIAFKFPALFIGEVIFSIFRAVGDTTTPMKITLAAIVCNLIFDPLLIFGIGPFPEMGIAGAALATVIAYYIALIWAVIEIRKGKLPYKIFPKKILAIDLSLYWRVAKVGIPLAISGVVFSVVYLVLARVAAPFGDFVVASFRVGQLIESISFMVCFGFGQATASMIGQNLGARLPDRAEKSAWTAQGIITIFTLVISFILFFFAQPITRLFTNDIPTMTAAVFYLKIIALSQVFMGFEIVLEGAFSGAGDTLPPMLVSIVGTAIRIPLAIFLVGPMGMGYPGIYWALTISTVLKGVTIAIWFKLGRWKLKQI
ncbi:MAG: MATE family efflux transporter [candidate division Zixibacteria bacterium]|nr:MATE family efflux transporter [candidate division Zixibacteria bacterium]